MSGRAWVVFIACLVLAVEAARAQVVAALVVVIIFSASLLSLALSWCEPQGPALRWLHVRCAWG